MKNLTLITALILCVSIMSAQPSKLEVVFYSDVSAEAGDVSITAKGAFSKAEYNKFKLRLDNKSDGFILFKPEECKLKVNGKDYPVKEKSKIISPVDYVTTMVDTKGDFRVDEYSFHVSGLYKVSTEDKKVEAPDFQLPPAQNEFKAGNFSCTMTELTKQTDKTSVKFNCRYTGDKVGVICTNRAALKYPDGTEVANAKSKTEAVILAKGESEKISLEWKKTFGGKAYDMQKVALTILWRNTFIESDAKKLPSADLEFKLDQEKTYKK